MAFMQFKPKDHNVIEKKSHTLYHVSIEANLEPHHFIPRIPSRSLNGEDTTIPRICASDTISNCLRGCPDGYLFCTESVILQSAFLYVYEIDMMKIGYRNIRLWHELTDLVPDVQKTKEYWIQKDFVSTPQIYRFENMEYESKPTRGIRYRDIVVGRDNMDYILQTHKNIINFDKRDKNSYFISYFADDDTIRLWDEIAYSHKTYREDTLSHLLHYS